MMVGGNIRYQTRVLTTAIVLETGKGTLTLPLRLASSFDDHIPCQLGADLDPTAERTPLKALVEIHDLLVKRGDHPVLQLDELTILEGEVLAVVGPNGAGKSTLLLTLARLLKPERGKIQFNGQQVAAESDTSYRRRIASVMQDPLLLIHLYSIMLRPVCGSGAYPRM